MKSRFQISRSLPAIFLLLHTSLLHAVPPVLNYAGQVAVDGEPFEGKGLFKFALIKGDDNTTLWSNDGSSVNGSEPVKSVRTSVDGGLYSILLGNSSIKGMSSLDPSIFQKHSDIKLRVWFSDGINGFEQLSLDRSFASVPYAFSAGSAPIPQGSINRKMLSTDVRSDLNSSLKKITRDMLPKSVLEDLNSSIKKIKRDMLPDNVLAQLDRKLTRSDLPADVLTDLNRTIQLNSLSPEVLSALQVTPPYPPSLSPATTGVPILPLLKFADAGTTSPTNGSRTARVLQVRMLPCWNSANPTLGRQCNLFRPHLQFSRPNHQPNHYPSTSRRSPWLSHR